MERDSAAARSEISVSDLERSGLCAIRCGIGTPRVVAGIPCHRSRVCSLAWRLGEQHEEDPSIFSSSSKSINRFHFHVSWLPKLLLREASLPMGCGPKPQIARKWDQYDPVIELHVLCSSVYMDSGCSSDIHRSGSSVECM